MYKFIPFVLTVVLMSACASNPPAPKAVAVAVGPSATPVPGATVSKKPLLATGFDRYFNTQTENWEFPTDSNRASQ